MRDEPPFYRRSSFWLGPFTWGLGLVLAVALAIGWYVLGGWPSDHDKYGEVSVPGSAVLALPDGDVRLYFENHATHSGDSTSIDDRPPGLKVAVTPAQGGAPLEVGDVPSWLFSSTSNDRGHEPYGKIDVPQAGDYAVAASEDGQPAPAAKGGPPPEAPSIDEGAAISVGAAPWNPAGSRLLGAILVGVVVMAGVLILTLPFRHFLS